MHDGLQNMYAAFQPIRDGMKTRGVCPGKVVPSWDPVRASDNPWGSTNFVRITSFQPAQLIS
jgi:hypothetical protein